MSRLPPGPPPVGNNPIALLRYGRAISKDPLAFVRKRFERYGDTYTSHVGGFPTLVTRDPELIHQALVTDGASYQKPERGLGARQLQRLLGNGLVSSNGDFWRNQRRQIQPAFGAQHLREYSRVMVQYARDCADGWASQERVDLSEEMMTLTLRVVAKVLMGQSIDGQRDEVARAMTAFRASLGGVSSFIPKWIPYPPRTRERRANQRMRGMMRDFIASHETSIHVSGQPSQEHQAEVGECLLRVLARSLSEDSMSREQLVDEALTLFFAGHETTSHALTWTFYLLSQHRDVEQRLESELASVLGEREAAFEDFGQLTYTQQVISEAMRIFPPVFSIVREARTDTRLGPWDVPKGAHVLANIFHVHHDPRYHHAPEEFRPDRFEGERAKQLHPGAYVPFGGGTRVCIGKRFAMLEATLVLATLQRRLRFRLAQPHLPQPRTDITLSPKGGLRVRVERRD